jgi:ornithine cyclodeaminase/alanine dehydrogenase
MGAKLMASGRAREVEYVVVLFEQATGRIVAFVDGYLVTAYRTAATTALALDLLAPPGAARLGILGAGLEAANHVHAFAAIRTIESLQVFSPTPAKRNAFAEAMSEKLAVPCLASANARDAVQDATVIICAARSHGEEPIIFGDWLKPGMVVASIGSTVPGQREIDISVVEKADLIVCDTMHEVIEQTGDMIEAARSGIDIFRRCVPLAALARGEITDRARGAPIKMFKSVGSGLQDVVIAEFLCTRAIEAGVTTTLPIHFSTKLM